MSLYKFCLFSSQDFDFFRTPDFVGAEYLIMVALPYGTTTRIIDDIHIPLESLEISVADRRIAPTATQLVAMLESLKNKLSPDIQCKAIFDSRSRFSEWQFGSMQAVPVQTEKMPPEVSNAREFAAKFLRCKDGERKLQAPILPWQSKDPKDHISPLSRKSLRKYYDISEPRIAEILQEQDRKKKLLVHVCCGPDAAGVISQLKDDYEITCFWYDPNIQPKAEYDKRLDAFLKVCELLKVEAIVGEYDVDHFLNKISGLEASPEQGAKCTLCYDMRLERSAREAKARNCDLFTTTLAISPHKVQEKLKLLGQKLSLSFGIPYMAKNFMKDEGFKDSVRFTEENNIYRQDYCGCWFSLHEGGPEARALAEKTGLTKENLEAKTFSLPIDSV